MDGPLALATLTTATIVTAVLLLGTADLIKNVLEARRLERSNRQLLTQLLRRGTLNK